MTQAAMIATEPGILAPAKALPADRHPLAVYLGRLAPGSRRTMAHALESIAALATDGRLSAMELPWSQLRYQHTQRLRTLLAERFSPATVNKGLAALRGVLKEAWRLGLMDAEDYARAADLASVRGTTLPQGRSLDSGELRALFENCERDPTPAGARDASLLALLYGQGLRRAEAVGLALADYNPETGELKVRGKGNKERAAWLTNGAKLALDSWLETRGDAPGALLCPVDKAGRVTVRRMTSQAAYQACKKRAEAAGVRDFSPHDLRRSCISDLLDNGVDLVTVQAMVGHSNVQTTSRYDRRGERAKKAGAQKLVVPYRPGTRSAA